MPAGTLSKKYASALFGAALELGVDGPAKIQEALASVSEKLEGQALSALLSPSIPAREKTEMFYSLAGEKAPREARAFLSLLLEKKRLALFNDIFEVYSLLCEENKGVKRAEVFSASELDAAEKEKINSVLEKSYKKKFKLTYAIDTGMIGGLSIRIGNDLVDGSIRTNLLELREALNN